MRGGVDAPCEPGDHGDSGGGDLRGEQPGERAGRARRLSGAHDADDGRREAGGEPGPVTGRAEVEPLGRILEIAESTGILRGTQRDGDRSIHATDPSRSPTASNT
jgi:hypothetical protein